MADHENRRMLDWRIGNFLVHQQVLRRRGTGIKNGAPTDKCRHGILGRVNLKSVLSQQRNIVAALHAVPESRRPGRIPVSLNFLFGFRSHR